MEFKKAGLTACAAAFAAVISVLSVPALAAPARCEAVDGGVEYRAYLPDQKRYVYVSVKALSGYSPSIFVMIDKNYEAAKTKVASGDPNVSWWLDRSRPMTFSSDVILVRWSTDSTWTAVTSWIVSPDQGEIKQAIRGLEQSAGVFKGNGSGDTNTFAFQTRVEMPGFSGDSFDVTLPSVTYDGVTVAPPVVHFTRDGRTVTTGC